MAPVQYNMAVCGIISPLCNIISPPVRYKIAPVQHHMAAVQYNMAPVLEMFTAPFKGYFQGILKIQKK